MNGSYSKIKGKFIVDYETRSESNSSCTLHITDDDDRVIYTSPTITTGSSPIDFEVDLTGVNRITITMQKNGYTAGNFAIVNARLYQ